MIFDHFTPEQEAVVDELIFRCEDAGLDPSAHWRRRNPDITIDPDGVSWTEAAARILGARQPWLIWDWPIDDVINNADYLPEDLGAISASTGWLPPMPTS